MYGISHSYSANPNSFSGSSSYSPARYNDIRSERGSERATESRLEYLAQNASAQVSIQPAYKIISSPHQRNFYSSSREQNRLYRQALDTQDFISDHQPKIQTEYFFQPDDFLKPGKLSSFVGKAEEVKEFVEETFEKMFQQSFPDNIKISILEEKEFRKVAPSAGTIGLSLNRNKRGLISEIFILNDYLARVMLTIGHELGHVLTDSLENPVDEEAKAYAFSLAWMETIKEHDIAGLSEVIITENPAQNGLHNVAFSFVQKMKQNGKDSWNLYLELIQNISSVCI